ncbi:MAG: hypothetical protein H6577_13710 [Lewinellaceae bacterium]|nr:hypothetical protein [Lewinellaceae bacterium]
MGIQHENEGPGSESNRDYYIENGLLVFTRQYHLKRGYCCQSGCRHCPYGFVVKQGQVEKKEK